jgi:hypothetical protein
MRPDGRHHLPVRLALRFDPPGIPLARNQLGEGNGNLNVTGLGITAIHKTRSLSWLLDLN